MKSFKKTAFHHKQQSISLNSLGVSFDKIDTLIIVSNRDCWFLSTSRVDEILLQPSLSKVLGNLDELVKSHHLFRAHWSVGFAGSYLKSPQIVTTTREDEDDGDGDGMGEESEDPWKSAQTLNTTVAVTSASLWHFRGVFDTC